MVIPERNFRIISNGAQSEGRGHAGGWGGTAVVMVVVLAIIAAIGAAVGGAIGGATWGTAGSDPATAPQAAQARQESGPAPGFEYFPSQYTNQATKVEEHIQAF